MKIDAMANGRLKASTILLKRGGLSGECGVDSQTLGPQSPLSYFQKAMREVRVSELDLCLAWVRREQKAASKGARFGVHSTQVVAFLVFTIRGEMVAETRSSQAPTSDSTQLLFNGTYHASRLAFYVAGQAKR